MSWRRVSKKLVEEDHDNSLSTQDVKKIWKIFLRVVHQEDFGNEPRLAILTKNRGEYKWKYNHEAYYWDVNDDGNIIIKENEFLFFFSEKILSHEDMGMHFL